MPVPLYPPITAITLNVQLMAHSLYEMSMSAGNHNDSRCFHQNKNPVQDDEYDNNDSQHVHLIEETGHSRLNLDVERNY